MSQRIELLLQDDVSADERCILSRHSQVRERLCFPFVNLSGNGVGLCEPDAALIMVVLEKQESTERFQK